MMNSHNDKIRETLSLVGRIRHQLRDWDGQSTGLVDDMRRIYEHSFPRTLPMMQYMQDCTVALVWIVRADHTYLLLLVRVPKVKLRLNGFRCNRLPSE